MPDTLTVELTSENFLKIIRWDNFHGFNLKNDLVGEFCFSGVSPNTFYSQIVSFFKLFDFFNPFPPLGPVLCIIDFIPDFF